MKKIVNFIKQPHTTTLLSVVGLTIGFAVGIGIKNAVELQQGFNHKKSVCEDTFDVLCVQAHACTGNSVKECDKLVEEQRVCDINLPDIQAIYLCKEELRNIECEDDMPTSCSLFME